jgi:hypothetical protein
LPSDNGFRSVAFTALGGPVSRNANATISRLKRSVGNAEIPDVSNVKQNDVGGSGEIRFQFPFGSPGGLRDRLGGRGEDRLLDRSPLPHSLLAPNIDQASFDVGYRFTGVDGSTSGAGAQIPVLLFPSLGVQGTAGNNSNPNGYSVVNQPHTFGYGYEFNQHLFDTTFDVVGFNAGPNTVIRPIVGARGMFTEVNDSFATNLTFPNGFPVNALHTTNTDMFSGGLFAGMNLYHAPPGSPFLFIFSARGGFDVNRAESDVAFSIQTPVFNDLQRITVKDTAVTPYVRAEAGVAASVLGAVVRSTIFVEHGNAFPNVQIPGGGARPSIDFERETNFGGRFSLSWELDGGATRVQGTLGRRDASRMP